MPFKRLYLLLTISLCCTVTQLTAQEYSFIHYTPKDGLVNSRLRNMYQDSKGRLFFMTANGLSMYDGARFTNYSMENGLPNPIVNDIFELGPDSLLLATNTGFLSMWIRGAIKMHPTTDNFCPVINKFFRSAEKILYVASDEGIFRFEKNRFLPINVGEKNETGNPVAFEDIREAGDYLILKEYDTRGKSNKVYWVNKKTEAVKIFNIDDYVFDILLMHDQKLLLIVTAKGIRSFDLTAAGEGLIKEIKLPSQYQFLQKHPIQKLMLDNKKNIWGLTQSSVLRINAENNLMVFNKTNGLDVNNINNFFIDREKILWILTDGSGILKLTNTDVEIVNRMFGSASMGLTSLLPDTSEDKTWVFNTNENKLYCKNGNQLNSWSPTIPLNLVTIKKHGKVLYLFEENLIYQAIPTEGSPLLTVSLVFSEPKLQMNFAEAFVDGEGLIYIPGFSLIVVKPYEYHLAVKMPYYTDQLAIDNNGLIWLASRSGDILCYELQNKKTKNPKLHLKFSFRSSEPHLDPRSITIDYRNRIWVGTRYKGLYCYEFTGSNLNLRHHLTVEDGLTDNFIYDIASDNHNVLWIATQTGLDKISMKEGKYVIEGITRNNSIFQLVQAVFLGTHNQVWALGHGNVIRINNEINQEQDYTPDLQITRIRMVDSTLEIPAPNLVFAYQNNNLTFEIAAPSFIDEKQVQFSYLLEGSDNNKWSEPSTTATFNFINLPHGDYVLRVKAFFPVPKYQSQELSYPFTIQPPWFRTWWFGLLILVSGVALIAFIIRSYYRRKLQNQKMIFEKQKAIEQERTRIAMEMHDDLGSGLTTIRYLAGGLTIDSGTNTKTTAAKIATSAKELVDNMNDIIWTMKSDNNTLEEVLGYIRKQAAEQLENAGIDYSFDFPKQIPVIILNNDQKRNLLLISKEAVHNIIKHAQASTVHLKALVADNKIVLVINDNGKGFDASLNPLIGNGLKSMRKRAEEINARLEILNGTGTTVSVTVPV